MGAVIEPEPSPMLAGGEVRLLKIGMDRFGHGLIGGGSSGGSHMRDEMRGIFLTGFGEMHFIACPSRLALFARAGFWIIGRVDELVGWRKILIAAPMELAFDPDVVLDPDAAQDRDGRDLTQKGGSHGSRRDPSASLSRLDR